MDKEIATKIIQEILDEQYPQNEHRNRAVALKILRTFKKSGYVLKEIKK